MMGEDNICLGTVYMENRGGFVPFMRLGEDPEFFVPDGADQSTALKIDFDEPITMTYTVTPWIKKRLHKLFLGWKVGPIRWKQIHKAFSLRGRDGG